MNSPNYFISIDIEFQISSLLKNKVIEDSLFDNLDKIKSSLSSEGTIRDVYDGSLYKKLLAAPSVPNSQLLTYNFNTDGAPLFHSSKQSFWSILLILNELPAKLRFKNPLLAGLWLGKKEPSADMMNLFMN